MEKLSYEEAVKELNQIISKLEEGTLTMNKAVELFERGQLLIKICYEKLETAKGKITEIKEVLGNIEEV